MKFKSLSLSLFVMTLLASSFSSSIVLAEGGNEENERRVFCMAVRSVYDHCGTLYSHYDESNPTDFTRFLSECSSIMAQATLDGDSTNRIVRTYQISCEGEMQPETCVTYGQVCALVPGFVGNVARPSQNAPATEEARPQASASKNNLMNVIMPTYIGGLNTLNKIADKDSNDKNLKDNKDEKDLGQTEEDATRMGNFYVPPASYLHRAPNFLSCTGITFANTHSSPYPSANSIVYSNVQCNGFANFHAITEKTGDCEYHKCDFVWSNPDGSFQLFRLKK